MKDSLKIIHLDFMISVVKFMIKLFICNIDCDVDMRLHIILCVYLSWKFNSHYTKVVIVNGVLCSSIIQYCFQALY